MSAPGATRTESPLSPGLRLVAAVRHGAVLAARPRSVIAHVCEGPASRVVTASGLWVARKVRPLCRARAARLAVLPQPAAGGFDMGGRRLCRRCRPLLPAALGHCPAHRLDARSEWVQAYTSLTLADLDTAARWTRTVAETHEVVRVLMMTHGDKPRSTRGGRRGIPAHRVELYDLHTRLEAHRSHLRVEERTVEEVEADQATRDRLDNASARARQVAREEAARDRALDRRRRGDYLTTWERALIA